MGVLNTDGSQRKTWCATAETLLHLDAPHAGTKMLRDTIVTVNLQRALAIRPVLEMVAQIVSFGAAALEHQRRHQLQALNAQLINMLPLFGQEMGIITVQSLQALTLLLAQSL